MQARASLMRVTPTGTAEQIGCASMYDDEHGVHIRVSAKGLAKGEYGMHIHAGPSCKPGWSETDQAVIPAGAAGPHYDPYKTHAHRGPKGGGHAGDLPRFRSEGPHKNTRYFLLRGVSLPDLVGKTFIIHEGGDNFSDEPKANGGAGPRRMCGAIRAVTPAGSRYPGAMSTRKFSADRVEHTRRVENRHYLCVAHDTERAAIQPIRLVAGLVGGPLVGYAAWNLRRDQPVLATGLGVVAASMSAWSLYVFTKAEIEMRKGEGR